MKTLIQYLLMIAISIFAVAACQKKKPKITNKAGELPLLTNTNTLGMIVGFNADNPPATQDSIDQVWNEALEAGMNGARLQIDWPGIEISEGVYDKVFMEEQLNSMNASGLKTHLLISAYDSEGPDVPEYLEGLPIDDEKVISSFKNLMNWVIPMLVENGGYAIAVSNEPDNAFLEDKDLVKRMLNFFIPVRDHIHGMNENMGVSITMNTGNLTHSRKDMKKIMKEVDYGCFNLYGGGLEGIDKPYTVEQNEENIREMLDFAGSKYIVIQELGMHSDTELLNSSEEIQRDFFKTFFTMMEQEPRIKAAYVFQLVDWSPATVAVLNSLYEPGTPQSFIDQYGRVLETIGLIDFETGNRRLALDEVLTWMEKF